VSESYSKMMVEGWVGGKTGKIWMYDSNS